MIKPYLEKSTQSMSAAQLLIKEHLPASTVNRAYYACVQYILHVLVDKLNHTWDDIQKQPGSSTHSKAQYLLEHYLYQKCKDNKENYKDYKWFQQKFPEIKLERNKADYQPDVISPDEGHKAITKADTLMNVMVKYFKK